MDMTNALLVTTIVVGLSLIVLGLYLIVLIHHSLRAADRGREFLDDWLTGLVDSMVKENRSTRRLGLLALKLSTPPGSSFHELSDEEKLEFLRGVRDQEERCCG